MKVKNQISCIQCRIDKVKEGIEMLDKEQLLKMFDEKLEQDFEQSYKAFNNWVYGENNSLGHEPKKVKEYKDKAIKAI